MGFGGVGFAVGAAAGRRCRLGRRLYTGGSHRLRCGCGCRRNACKPAWQVAHHRVQRRVRRRLMMASRSAAATAVRRRHRRAHQAAAARLTGHGVSNSHAGLTSPLTGSRPPVAVGIAIRVTSGLPRRDRQLGAELEFVRIVANSVLVRVIDSAATGGVAIGLWAMVPPACHPTGSRNGRGRLPGWRGWTARPKTAAAAAAARRATRWRARRTRRWGVAGDDPAGLRSGRRRLPRRPKATGPPRRDKVDQRGANARSPPRVSTWRSTSRPRHRKPHDNSFPGTRQGL